MVTVSKETAINNIVMDETLKPVGVSLKLIVIPVVSICVNFIKIRLNFSGYNPSTVYVDVVNW